MKQAGPEFLTDVELNQEKASQTGEFLTEPTFYNHLNRVRVSVTTPEHSLHRYTLTSELHARLWSFPWWVSLPCSDRNIKSAQSRTPPATVRTQGTEKAKPTKPNEAKLPYHWMMAMVMNSPSPIIQLYLRISGSGKTEASHAFHWMDATNPELGFSWE